MPLRRRWKALTRNLRELGSIGSALADTGHPYMAHIVPMRRCNLACTYCNEFDDVSDPVPIEEMERRIDELGRLGTSVITISGGEPLLHPELDRVVARIRKTGAIAGMITNGYLLTPERIHRLNRAGLDHMQISIDNVMPDDVSKKSLKVLDAKLKMLAENYAEVSQVLRDAFEDAILMGVDEQAMRQVLASIVAGLESPKRRVL